MLRIKLFGLFIAYAMVALVRPREMRKMLDAADRGAKPVVLRNPFTGRPRDVRDIESDPQAVLCVDPMAALRAAKAFEKTLEECPLPPAGWRCTRRAGHDGPCAAVEVDDVRLRCAAVMGWRERWKANQAIAGADMLAMLNEIEALRAELAK